MPVKGLNATISRLRKFDARVQQEVKEEVFDTAQQIASEATARAPKSIVVVAESRNKGFSAVIKANAGKLAAYVEFGTGLSASAYVPTLPKEWQSLAMLYYVNGEGKMKKQPYLYPAYFRNVPLLVNNLKAMLKREAKR